MEKMRIRIVRYAAALIFLAVCAVCLPQNTYAAEETSEGQKDIYLPELVEEEVSDDGIEAYAEEDGEDFHGTDQELYAIMEQRVKDAMLTSDTSEFTVSFLDLKAKVDDYHIRSFYCYSPYFPTRLIDMTLYIRDGYYSKVEVNNSFGNKEKTKEVFDEIDQKLASIYALVDDPGMTDFDKALVIHDYLVSHAYYDISCTYFTSYGVLVAGKGVCQSFAGAYMYLMHHLGIDAYFVPCETMKHGWNVIRIDGALYNVDTTWDLGSYTGADHTHFLFNNDEMDALGYTYIDEELLYICNSTRYSNTERRRATSPVVFKDGLLYFVKDGNLYCGTSRKASEIRSKKDLKDALVKTDDALYYASRTKVYRYSFKKKRETVVYEVPEPYQRDGWEMEGMLLEDGQINGRLDAGYQKRKSFSIIPTEDQPIADGWLETEDGWRYYRDDQPLYGWQWLNRHWYYLDPDSGLRKTGRLEEKGNVYYLDENGVMQTGFVGLWDGVHYFNKSGQQTTSWQKVDGKWYYLDGDGLLQYGWMELQGKWYYLSMSDGEMAVGWKLIQGNEYYFNKDGHRQTGWQKRDDIWCYLNQDGELQTEQWINDNYYVDYEGNMVVDDWIWVDDNDRYYVDADGRKVKNRWAKIWGDWYCFSKEGLMRRECWIGDYYVRDDGIMATNQMVGDYYVDSDGVWIKNTWMNVEGQNYYFGKDGKIAKNRWAEIDGDWYCFNKEGQMRTNCWIGDYYVLEDGKMAKDQWIGNYYVDADGKWVKGQTKAA